MTGNRLKMIAWVVSLFFWPLLFIIPFIPSSTWERWAERYF